MEPMLDLNHLVAMERMEMLEHERRGELWRLGLNVVGAGAWCLLGGMALGGAMAGGVAERIGFVAGLLVVGLVWVGHVVKR